MLRAMLILVLSATLLPQTPPDAKALLARADAAIFTAKTVRLAATTTTGVAGRSPISGTPFQMEFVRGGRGRARYGGDATITLIVFDGTNQWEYHDLGKQYTRKPATAWTFEGEIAKLDYGRNSGNIAAASYENDETIDFNGRQFPCFVIRADYHGAPNNRLGKQVVRRVWVSKDAELILRDYWEGPLTPVMTARLTETTHYTTIETDVPLADSLFVFQPPAGSKEGEPVVVGGVLGGIAKAPDAAALAPPPPPPPPVSTTNQRVTVHGTVAQANLIRKVNPVYPPEARQGRVSGVVVLNAMIGKDGTVQNLNVLSGPALLRNAAIDAVKQWLYKPTLMNGSPVEVMTTITITFSLS